MDKCTGYIFQLNKYIFKIDTLYTHRIIKIHGELMSGEKLYIHMYNIYIKYGRLYETKRNQSKPNETKLKRNETEFEQN